MRGAATVPVDAGPPPKQAGAAVSLAVATSALAWGVAQPVCGALVRTLGAPRLLAVRA